MNTRKRSTRSTFGRGIRFESLEQRCLLSATAISSFDVTVISDVSIVEPDSAFVARAVPADATIEQFTSCTCASTEPLKSYPGDTTSSGISNDVVDEAVETTDFEDSAGNPPEYELDILAVQRTLTEKPDAGEIVAPEPLEILTTFIAQPETDNSGIGTGDVLDDLQSVGEQEVDPNVVMPHLHYMSSIVESVIDSEPERPKQDVNGFDVPANGQEQPGIYTLGGIVTTSNSQSTTTNTNTDRDEHEVTTAVSRVSRRELRAERVRERYERNLLSIANTRPNTNTTTTGPTSTANVTPTTSGNNAQSSGTELEQSLNLVRTAKHRVLRLVGRR